tara:strand:+ start:840 stop:1337 length:498 start_codon:yes stop_codon:yes gene_type:complete
MVEDLHHQASSMEKEVKDMMELEGRAMGLELDKRKSVRDLYNELMDHQASVADEQAMAWAYVPQELCDQDNVHPVEEFVEHAPAEEHVEHAPAEEHVEAPVEEPMSPLQEAHAEAEASVEDAPMEDAPAEAPVEMPAHDEVHYEDAPAEAPVDAPVEDPNVNPEG